MEEEWIPITVKEYPNYEVSNLGRLRNKTKGTLLKGAKDKDGYVSICLSSSNGKQKSFRLHRIIALAFIPNIENKPEINHKNEIRDDNRVENLEWVTCTENNNYGDRLLRISEKTKK